MPLWTMPKDAFHRDGHRRTRQHRCRSSRYFDATEIKVKKAYPAYFDTYKDIKIVQDHLNTITNLYCVGRNGQHRYNNMDHSMLTAMDAVKSMIDPSSFQERRHLERQYRKRLR
jgi:UDP-galactopyranose mutase